MGEAARAFTIAVADVHPNGVQLSLGTFKKGSTWSAFYIYHVADSWRRMARVGDLEAGAKMFKDLVVGEVSVTEHFVEFRT
jgi:hypothetical protein